MRRQDRQLREREEVRARTRKKEEREIILESGRTLGDYSIAEALSLRIWAEQIVRWSHVQLATS